MSTKVDQASTVDSHPSPSTSTKISKFGAKSGFVIPKNKLSGSLVPIFRGSTKSGFGDASKDEGAKQVQRKTKWGPDLTQDASVRRGRALAYRARVDQISQQLKSGTLEIDDHESSPLITQASGQETSSQLKNNKSLELLQLERHESIGEILKLNPSYKAPPDYKPLLKEAKVPVPLKEYPRYNFIGLIFGPGGDTLRGVEKEAGAKIRVCGIKADEGEKVEISLSDGFEIQDTCEEIYIHVLADTYDKVDAAVALMELLVTPISGVPAVSKTASVSGVTALNQSQDTLIPDTISSAAVKQGHMQPPQSEQQPRPRPWLPRGPPSTLLHGPSSFGPSKNPSAPVLSNPANLSSPVLNPSNMLSLFGPRPSSVYGSGPVPQNPLALPPWSQPPLKVQDQFMPPPQPLVHPTAPRNSSMLGPMPSLPLHNNPALPQVTGNHIVPTGPPSMPSVPQQMAFPPLRQQPNLPLTPNANSTGWSAAASVPPASLGPSNMVMAPPQGPTPAILQPIEMPTAPLSGLSAANIVPSVTFSPLSSAPGLSNHPTGAPNFPSVPPPELGVPSTSTSFFPAPGSVPAVTTVLNQPSPTGQVQPRMPAPSSSSNHLLGSGMVPTASQPQPPHPGNSANISGFTPLKPPPVATPRPGDFTFQPHQQQSPVPQMVPRLSNQPAVQNTLPSNPAVQPPLAPHEASFQFGVHNATSKPTVQVFPRPPFSNQMGQPQPQASTNKFPGTSAAISGSPRPPMFPNPSALTPQNPAQQMGPRNFAPAPQLPNLPGPLPPRAGNPLQLQQSYPASAGRPGNFFVPTQQFCPSGTFASRPGGHQIYDPFSPTSVSVAPP